MQKGTKETRQLQRYGEVMRLHEAAPKLIIQERVGDKVKVSSYWPVPELTRAELALGRLHDPWENSPTSLTAIEPKQRHSSTNSTTISYSTSTSQGSTPQLKRSPWPSCLSKGPKSPDGQGR